MGAAKNGSILVLGLWWILLGTAWAGGAQLAEILLQAEAQGEPIPVLSTFYPGMNLATAYGIQKAYVEQKGATTKIVGFKAGLTSDAGQKKFGLTAPVTGVLFASGRLTSPAVIDSTRFGLPMIETEIGFVMGKRLTRPLTNVAELKNCVTQLLPVIELPDLGFTRMKDLKGVDIIAANVSARNFIVGSGHPKVWADPDKVGVTLSLDGDIIHRGKGTDVLGNQWDTAFWLANQTLAQGWSLEPGQVMITGAMGPMVPGKPGRYVADYGVLGRVLFEIR
ncbi:MAG: fumarylacetoacetate hydrolase family protein [Proteobacteria bacterium]|nr:fumarylacetoacetate hydrolase family protein [Pseudomonadota bacterium]